jgi:hypothetical protein
MSLAA